MGRAPVPQQFLESRSEVMLPTSVGGVANLVGGSRRVARGKHHFKVTSKSLSSWWIIHDATAFLTFAPDPMKNMESCKCFIS